jgi:hypothetical protein
LESSQTTSKNKWIDRRTKSIFFEFTIFSADSKVFNVVKLTLERTPFGNFVPSSTVYTTEFIHDFRQLNVLLKFAAFVFMLFIVTVNFIANLNSRKTRKNVWIVADFLIVLLSIAFLALSFTRNFYVTALIDQLEASANNDFVSFNLASFHDFSTAIVSSFLVAITAIRLWKILNFSAVFRAFNLTLFASAVPLLSALLIVGIVLLAFAAAIFIINGSQAKIFSTFTKTFLALTANCLGFNRGDQFDDVSHGGNLLGFLVIACMMIVMNIFLFNLLVTIVVIYISRVKEAMQNEPVELTMWEFLGKKWRRIVGKPPQNELKFMHKNYTIDRANHFKLIIEAQLEFIEEYLKEFPETAEKLKKSQKQV